jgi:hypothetical protein
MTDISSTSKNQMDTNRTVRPVKKLYDDFIYSDFEKSSSSSGVEFTGKRKRPTTTCGSGQPNYRKRLKKTHEAINFQKREQYRQKRESMSSDEREVERQQRRHKRATMTMITKRNIRDQERKRQLKYRHQLSEEDKIQNRIKRRNDNILKKERNKTYGAEQPYDKVEEACNYDAKAYLQDLKNKIEFKLCAICGYEGPLDHMQSIESLENDIEKCQLSEEFNEWIIELQSGSEYDMRYSQAVLEEMADGLLIGVQNVCDDCAKFMQKPTTQKEVIKHASIPPHALVRGLFPGSIPKELQGLTVVERSMISIYSNTTKIALNCEGHPHASPTLYTIVNEDLVSVCEILPRIPAENEFAILRHRGAGFIHEFKYRPSRVREALIWLRQNNHLYHPDKIGFNDDLLDSSMSEKYLEQPYFEVDDDEVDAVFSHIKGSIPSTNSGIC